MTEDAQGPDVAHVANGGEGHWLITKGSAVVGADGEKVGEVIGFSDTYIVVEKGFFFPTDYYIPGSAIASANSETVTLTLDREAALKQGWDVIPGDESVGTPGGAFLTGATSYDEPVGVNIRGDEYTDADLRVGTESDGDQIEDVPVSDDADEQETDR
jgi:hypothetical protein